MLFELINEALGFLSTNAILVALMMAVIEYVKGIAKSQSWYQGWYITAFGFLLGFVFAVPAAGFVALDVVAFVSHGVILGLVATGIYKTGESLVG